jgi:uncharacterized protein YvpB
MSPKAASPEVASPDAAPSKVAPLKGAPSREMATRHPIISHSRRLVNLVTIFVVTSLALILVTSGMDWPRANRQEASAQDASLVTSPEADPPSADPSLETASSPETDTASTVDMQVEAAVPSETESATRGIGGPLRLVDEIAFISGLNLSNAAQAGWHTVDGTRRYYLMNGDAAKGTINIDGVAVTFDDEGNWVSSRLDVPYISQLPDMPAGCEVVSVVMMLNFAGVEVSKEELAANLPYADDPNEGFTGSLYAGLDSGIAGIIWPPALLDLVRGYQESAVDLTGTSWETVRGLIDQNKPVCIWFNSGGFHHTVLLTGYSDTVVWLNDPLVSKDSVLDLAVFLQNWEQNEYRALSY